MRGSGWPASGTALETSHPHLECFELFAGACKHCGLDVELLAGDEVHTLQCGPDHCTHVALDILRRAAGDQFTHAAGQVIEGALVDHRRAPAG